MNRIIGLAAVGLGVLVAGCGGTDDQVERTRVTRAAIVDGYVDDADKAAVGLGIDFFGNFMGHCSGTLIAPNLVLTARHCVAMTPQGNVDCSQTSFGLMGGGGLFRITTQTERPTQDGPAFYKGVGNVIVPPDSKELCGYDIALIVLEGAGIPESEAKPIVPRIDSRPSAGEAYSAVGYGLTDPNDQNSSGTRMRLDGRVVQCLGGTCSGFQGEQVKPTEWMGESGTCPGDSGGPALDGQGRVMGVLSRGYGTCGDATYGDVSAWKDLLVETAKAAAAQGGYAPPFWAESGSSTSPPDGGSGTGGGSGTSPQGQPCGATQGCPGGYQCLAAGGEESGQCAAICDPAQPSCSAGTHCDEGLKVCAPSAAVTEASDSGGCSASGPAKPVPWLTGALLGLVVALRRRHAQR